ncbi:MAG: hypothetical protein HY985_14870 [Magnetospirillum sp.]|nr:hypothetical protein [Magnetospirillum sp.]
MSVFRPIAAAMLLLPLSGCGVPDLVAHGVKEYQKSRDARQADAAAPAGLVQPVVARSEPAVDRDPEPPPPAVIVQPPEKVTVEALPAR